MLVYQVPVYHRENVLNAVVKSLQDCYLVVIYEKLLDLRDDLPTHKIN